MLVSHRWISALTGVSASAEEMANRLTFSGLEVEAVEKVGDISRQIVVAEIQTKEAHPKRDTLSVVTVDSGSGTHQIVCGAPNCPGPGGRVVLALPGARLGGEELAQRELGGVLSGGMLLSEDELGVGPDDGGLLLLNGETDAPLGTPIQEALDLTDWIIDVAVTPNRPDALSHYGIAREVCLLFGRPYIAPDAPASPVDGDAVDRLAKVTVLAEDLCPRYAAAVVHGVSWGPSPFSVRYRLHNLGVRPISNLVDATNMVMLAAGQPIHAFDLDKLAGGEIVVRRAAPGERMVTLDGMERTFDSADLLICDAEKPVAVAGVMGGEESGVGETTTRVLIECAYFDPSAVRRTSRRLKLFSDAAYRFERGMDPGAVGGVIARAAAEVISLAGGKRAPGVIDCYPTPIVPSTLRLRPQRYRQVIGCDVAAEEMAAILTGIGATARISGDAIEVVPPTGRPDIEREIDLIEEVVRIRGFDEVPTTAPKISSTPPKRDYFEAERRAKEILAGLGLNEAVSYSFLPRELLSLLHADAAVVAIANPLSSERASMRTTLIGGLLENLKRAQSRFLSRFTQFEVARTYHDVQETLPREVLRAAGVMFGPAETWVGEPERQLDFFDVKGVVTAFIDAYSGDGQVSFAPTSWAAFHPRRALDVRLGEQIIGTFGELHPAALSALKLHRGVLAFELALFDLWQGRQLPAAAALPEFPPVSRDVALLVDDTQDAGDMIAAFQEQIGELAEAVRLFDVYTGDNLPEGKKSLAFSVTYRAPDRTLTDKEVDGIHKKALDAVSSRFGAVQR